MAENISNKISDKSKDEDYIFAKKVRNYRKFVKFYLIPIISVLVFLLILIFTIIPNVRYMINGLEEGKELREESKELDNRIARLKAIQLQEERDKQILAKVNQIIPSEQSEVVNFRQKVAGFAIEQRLAIESLQAGENIVEEKDILNKKTNNQLIEIPSKFSFSGGFDSFRQLFIRLYEGEDFFIITDMSLDVNNLNVSGGSWKGQFDLTKYQFSEGNGTLDFTTVPETEPINQEVVRFIEQNFGL